MSYYKEHTLYKFGNGLPINIVIVRIQNSNINAIAKTNRYVKWIMRNIHMSLEFAAFIPVVNPGAHFLHAALPVVFL